MKYAFVALIAAAAFHVSAAASAAADKYHVTAEEHVACDGDVISLCGTEFPDQDKVIGCMRVKLNRLSAACLTVFKAGMRRRHLPL